MAALGFALMLGARIASLMTDGEHGEAVKVATAVGYLLICASITVWLWRVMP